MWLWPWLVGLLLLTLFSSFTGGKNDLHFGVDMAVTAVFSLADPLLRAESPASRGDGQRTT